MSDTGPGLLIRHFQAYDQAAARTLILDGLGDHFPLIDTTLNPDLDDICVSYIEKGHIFLVAEFAGQIIGTGALVEVDDRLGRIVRLSVARDHRRQGVGVAFVARLIELARSRQYETLVVETNSDWFEAIALYRNCGFEPYDRDQVSIYLKLELTGAS